MYMKKRVYVRLGDIFCVEADDFKCYFQYIVDDKDWLNSRVIRVFKRHYPLDYVPNMDEIVSDEVSFYAHTIIRVGLSANAWYKVGNHNDLGNTTDIMFRWYYDVNTPTHVVKSQNWYIWKINEPRQFVGEMNDHYRKYNLGIIFSYIYIVAKIKTDNFLMKILD